MSAVEEYREYSKCFYPNDRLADKADAAIAAMEVENAGLVFHRDALLEELDDLNARRCETCKSYDVDTRFCAALTQHWHPRFYCAGWADGITP